MPINQLRILTLPIIGAVFASFLSGDLAIPLLVLTLLSVLPIFYIEDLEAVRDHWAWRLYGLGTFAIVAGLNAMGISLKFSIFFLVYFCLVYELYGEKRKQAPTRLIGLLSFLILLYHARVEAGLGLMSGVLIYLFSLVLCLMLLQSSAPNDYRRLETRRLPWSLLHFAAVFAMGLAIFWAIPRLPQQSLGAIPSLLGDRISGFGDRVDLNDIGSLKRSRKHVMDLVPLDGAVHSQYLRGRVLETYEDGVWSANNNFMRFPHSEANDYRIRRAPDGARTFAYRVDLQPLRGNTLFFMETLLALEGNLRGMRTTNISNHISVQRAMPIAFTYTFTSTDSGRRADRIAEGELRVPDAQRAYLEPLVAQVLADPELQTPRDRATAILSYFARNFSYTLDVANVGQDDPLEYFLNTSRAGHCELYATSMALMLRVAEIPARYVTGFLLPPPHSSGSFFHITESDAHSWVEYHDGREWVTADPTPAADYLQPGFIESQMAALKHFWRSKVMSWNFEAQRGFLESAGDFFQNLGKGGLDGRLLRLAILALALLGVLIGVWQFLARRDRARGLQRQFRRLETHLTKRYRPRGPRENWQTYLRGLPLERDLSAELDRFVRDYQAFRFAASAPVAGSDLHARGKTVLADLRAAPEKE